MQVKVYCCALGEWPRDHVQASAHSCATVSDAAATQVLSLVARHQKQEQQQQQEHDDGAHAHALLYTGRNLRLPPHNTTCAELACPADTYYPFNPPADPEHVCELGYTYRDTYAIKNQRRKLLAFPSIAVPSTAVGFETGRVGSAAGKAALQRALKQWTGGYEGYQWQVQFTNLKRYQHVKKPANVFVLLKDMPGAPAMPVAQGSVISPDDVRTRPDFCGSVEGFSDDMSMADKTRAVSAAVDVTDCLQRAGIKTAVAPANAADSKSGPSEPAVKVSQLKFLALAPDGTDMTKTFKFGNAVISWTKPLKLRIGGAAGVASEELMVKSAGNEREVVFSQVLGYI